MIKNGKYTKNNPNMGWECPRCGRINSPYIALCSCSKDITYANANNAERDILGEKSKKNDCPKNGDKRTIKRFQWWPECLPESDYDLGKIPITRWMTTVEIEQEFVDDGINSYWENIRWTDV
jgi:hypothetical protein